MKRDMGVCIPSPMLCTPWYMHELSISNTISNVLDVRIYKYHLRYLLHSIPAAGSTKNRKLAAYGGGGMEGTFTNPGKLGGRPHPPWMEICRNVPPLKINLLSLNP